MYTVCALFGGGGPCGGSCGLRRGSHRRGCNWYAVFWCYDWYHSGWSLDACDGVVRRRPAADPRVVFAIYPRRPAADLGVVFAIYPRPAQDSGGFSQVGALDPFIFFHRSEHLPNSDAKSLSAINLLGQRGWPLSENQRLTPWENK